MDLPRVLETTAEATGTESDALCLIYRKSDSGSRSHQNGRNAVIDLHGGKNNSFQVLFESEIVKQAYLV